MPASAAPDAAATRLARLRAALENQAWAADTSASAADWSKAVPSFGQCAVTALVMQDLCGGRPLRCTADGVSHYFNELLKIHVPTVTNQSSPSA